MLTLCQGTRREREPAAAASASAGASLGLASIFDGETARGNASCQSARARCSLPVSRPRAILWLTVRHP
jgi:hypothetical protein